MFDKGPIKQVNHVSVSELLNVLREYMHSYIYNPARKVSEIIDATWFSYSPLNLCMILPLRWETYTLVDCLIKSAPFGLMSDS